MPAFAFHQSADNIFVFHETWATSRMLRYRGQRATSEQRVSWTIRQAALPLFFANMTTAASLFVNCLSSLVSIFQFGLCGGTLIFVNFLLALCATPAILLLHEMDDEPERAIRNQRSRNERTKRLIEFHQMLWDHRSTITAGFGLLVVLLAPFALSLRPGADATFTFAPDPAMVHIVSRARLGPTDEAHIFKAPEVSSLSPLPALMSGGDGVGVGGSKGIPARYAALLDGTYVVPAEEHHDVEGFAFFALFAWLQGANAAMLMAFAIALRSEGSFLIFKAPQIGQASLVTIASLFSLAGLCSASSHLDTILSLTVCDFTREMRIFHGEFVGVMCLLHAAFFAHVSQVARRGVSDGIIHVMDWMSQYQSLAVQAYRAVSVASGAVGVIVLYLVNRQTQWPEITFGWTLRGPAGAALLTSLVWLYDGFMLCFGAAAADCGEAASHFRSRPEWLLRLQILSNLHSFAGWSLLFISGLPISRDLPASPYFDALSLWLLLNAIAHALLLRVLHRGTPSSWFQTTNWSRRHQPLALLIQGLLVIGFGAGATVAFVNADNPTVCDSDSDHRLTLREVQSCLDALLDDMFSLHLSTIFLGTCLAALWILDALVCAVAANVVRTREPYGFFRPLDAASANPGLHESRLLRRLQAASATFGLLGLAVLLLSFSPPAFGAAFGPKAILASNLLGFSLLLLHAPLLFTLTFVLRKGVPVHMLHPTEASRRSQLPAVGTFLSGCACFGLGLTIVITQNALPDLVWPCKGFNSYGLVLFLLLLCDAYFLLSLSHVQSSGEHLFIFRPLPSVTDAERLRLAGDLSLCGGSVLSAAIFASWAAFNSALGSALFGTTRALAIVLELSLALHGLGMLATGYLFHRRLAFGVLEPLQPHETGLTALSRLWPWFARVASQLCPRPCRRAVSQLDMPLETMLRTMATFCVAFALLLPLADGWHWWEAIGVLCFALLVFGTVVTHGMYAGNVIVQAASWERSSLRRAAFVLTTLFAMALGSCFANAVAGHRRRMPYYAFVPLEYVLIVAVAVFSFVNFVPIAAAMEVRYTGRSICGFSADDVPQGRSRLPWAFTMLCAAMVCASVGGAAWTTAQGIVSLDEDAWRTAAPGVQVGLAAAERCNLYFGVDFPPDARAYASLVEGVDVADPAAQLELLAACSLLRRDDSPIHPDGRQSTSWGCFMAEFQSWLVANERGFPVSPPEEFHRSVIEFLKHSSYWLRSEVGLWDGGEHGAGDGGQAGSAPPRRVVWLRIGAIPTKFAGGSGEEAMTLLADPILLLQYKAEWDTWLKALPRLTRDHSPNSTTPVWRAGIQPGPSDDKHEWTVPAASESVLLSVRMTSAKWSLLATVLAFYRSASTALSITPLVSMGAIALFTRSLIISYAALYCLAAMVLTLLGLMKLCGLSFGAVSALALALVLGMSVDYIIHIAHAFKNTVLPQRFYKSRATVLARATSVGSAAATTLAAVSPLLFAQLLPLREFGQIFTMVTMISLSFSLAFLTLLMMFGPKMTRRRAADEADEAGRVPHHEEMEPRLAEVHSMGDGWAVQLVDVVEASGPRREHAGARAGLPPQSIPQDEMTHSPNRDDEERLADEML